MRKQAWRGEGKEKHALGVREARSLSRDAGRVSSRPFGTVMISEPVKCVLGTIEDRSRFLMTVFLLSTVAASAWTDNSTGECVFINYGWARSTTVLVAANTETMSTLNGILQLYYNVYTCARHASKFNEFQCLSPPTMTYWSCFVRCSGIPI